MISNNELNEVLYKISQYMLSIWLILEIKSFSFLVFFSVLICVYYSNEDLDIVFSLIFNDQFIGIGLEEGGLFFFDLIGFGDFFY